MVQPFIDGRSLAEQAFRDITLHINPKIRRNLRFNIASLIYFFYYKKLLTYNVVKTERGIPKLEEYKMEHINDNPEKKIFYAFAVLN